MENIYVDGTGVIAPEEATKAPIRVFGASAFPNCVSTFYDFESLSHWVATLPSKEIFARAFERAKDAKAMYQENFEKVKDQHVANVDLVQNQIERLAESLELNPGSEEFFLKATAVESDPLLGPALHSGTLFEHHNGGGRSLFMNNWTYYPDLRLTSIGNDVASCVRVNAWSIVFVFEHIWFDGRMTAFFGLWNSTTYNMDAVVNDSASSAFCVGF